MEKNVVKVRNAESDKMSSETIDERRQESTAYQYLRRLEEARLWIQSCIGEDLPSGIDFEERLRNGIYLAKLGNHISPEIVPLKKIFDPNHRLYNDRGLQFRHTDNINHWLRALEYVGFPMHFLPDTFDVYDKRNMPKVIYCLHALSLYLHKLGRAPQIKDLSGKVHFTSEEINIIQREFEKYGVQMPSFSTIGGILTSEMGVDDAVQHACILAINDAVDKRNKNRILETLEDRNAGLKSIVKSHIERYQTFLFDAKRRKLQNAQKKCHAKNNDIPDVYDELLTQAEIQDSICQTNEMLIVEKINFSIKTQNVLLLQNVLSCITEVGINNTNMNLYMKFLSEAREKKYMTLQPGPLSRYEILAAIQSANNEVCNEVLVEKSLDILNNAIEERNVQLMIEALKSFPEQLDIHEFAAELYLCELAAIRNESNSSLTYNEVCGGIKMLSSVAVINKTLEDVEPDKTFRALCNNGAHIQGLICSFQQEYHIALNRIKLNKVKNGLSDFLNHFEIQECIDSVNKQSLQHKAIHRINDAIHNENTKVLWDALSCPEASILCVDIDQLELYFMLLSIQQKNKGMNSQEDLNRDEIQDVINQANKITLEANQRCLTIATINNALEDNRHDTLMTALQMVNTNGLLTIIPQFYPAYAAKLKSLKKSRERQCQELEKDDLDVSWLVCSVYKELSYHYNLKTLESSWNVPKSYSSMSKYLQQSDVINIIAAVNDECHKEQLKMKLEPLIIYLQSYSRGYLFRTDLAKRLNHFHENIDSIVKIQAWWRSKMCRRLYVKEKKLFNDNIKQIVKLQSYARMWLMRKKRAKERTLHVIHEQAARKIQTFWRAHKIRKEFKVLLHSSNPPLIVVQKFVYLLNISDNDYKEELKLKNVRSNIVQTIRYNQKLEKEADDMDLKIGMLIKNQITLQEVISQRKHTKAKKKDAPQMLDISWLGNGKGLKSFSKESRAKLEAYQHLFYTLQTEPSYLAKLLLTAPTGHASQFVESIILTLYNYGSTSREEYLLLSLLRKALEEEIQIRIDNILDIITGNSLVINMIIGFNRNGQRQICLRELLGPLIKNVIEDKNLHINTNPIEVYKFWINEVETETGQASSFPYIVTQNQALEHEEVKKRLDKSIQDLKEKTLLFFNTITSSLDEIPYSMLYVSRVLKDSLIAKFPDVAEKEILKIIGHFLYYRYLNSAIAAPDAYGIIDIGPNDNLTIKQRRNLASVAKVLQFAASGKGFGTDSPHLLCLNSFLKKCHEKFKEFFRNASSVVGPEIYFNMDAYSEAALLTYPTVYFTIQEICDIHILLVEYKNEIAPESSDPLHMLLEDLGSPSTVQILTGENAEISSLSSSRLGQTEICLTLSNKFLLADSEPSDVDKLYVKTKQLIINLLQYRKPADTLLSLLNVIPSSHEELFFSTRNNKSNDTYLLISDKSALPVNKYSSLECFQNELLHSLHTLELTGYVCKEDGYQAIINDISKDIENRHLYRQCRKEELTKLEQSQNKLDAKTHFYEEKLECYNQYIRKCLDNLSSANKKLRIKNFFNMLQKHDDVHHKVCLKYNGVKLQEKGVLLEITDLDTAEMKNVTFEISTAEESGIFHVRAKFKNIPMEKVEVDIQDLLQLQYEGVTVMNMFDRAKINVNLLLYLLNSKFYGKGK